MAVEAVRPAACGQHKSFHFGVDICGRDGTAVFAVEPGTAHLESPTVVAVVSSAAPRTFGYWHIVPAVRHHEAVARHQLLGHIARGWATSISPSAPAACTATRFAAVRSSRSRTSSRRRS